MSEETDPVEPTSEVPKSEVPEDATSAGPAQPEEEYLTNAEKEAKEKQKGLITVEGDLNKEGAKPVVQGGCTVHIGPGPRIRPTLKLTPPEGGWNVMKHQTEKKPVGRTGKK